MPEPDLRTLAAEAFIYGFPLVFDLEEVNRFCRQGLGSLPAAPFNEFAHATQLAGPDEKFVSVNNDTVYSIAQVDVSGGPVRLDVPATNGRYYVLQFVDAWTNNFAYLGHRATGTEAGAYLLVSAGWDGTLPNDETVIRFPTDVASIVGRWAVNGEQDLPAVHELQRGLKLSGDRAAAGIPAPDAGVSDALMFFERLRVWLQAFSPAPRDVEYQARFEPLGLLATQSPFIDPDPGLSEALVAGLDIGKKQLEDAINHGESPLQNGWRLTYHVFDYNLDFFEIGALDDPKWKLTRPSRFVERALAARGGLWGNHGYEAAYAMTSADGDGDELVGSSRYRLTFDTPPPVDAFWSVTMYDTPDYFLVANPIDRYSIGDRTPGLRYADDGSLTIVIQQEEPESVQDKANWLPAPEGAFRPILRMYEPRDSVFDGGYELPPVIKC